MTVPITGPFSKAQVFTKLQGWSNKPVDARWYKRDWYRQRRPYNLPLPFTYQSGDVLSITDPYGFDWGRTYYNGDIAFWPTIDTGNAAYIKAYQRFVNELKPDTAGLAINLVQRQQAIEMIATRSMQIYKFASKLKKGDLQGARRALGLTKMPAGWRKRGKSFGDKFLEAHFGWSPLVGDIYSSVDILQNGVPPSRVSVSSSVTIPLSYVLPRGGLSYAFSGTDKFVYRISATVKVDNPNLFLANQFGVVNPALVLYDAVPFSFVLNWFVNVEQFLSSFTDFWGLGITNPQITLFHERDATEILRGKDTPTNNAWGVSMIAKYKFVTTRRQPGSIPGPALVIKRPWTLSPSRGLTAISLLLQKLK